MSRASGWIAIVNPLSDGGFSQDRLRALRSTLLTVVDDVLVSERRGHVSALVAQASEADGILIGGGDGTVFEVLQSCDRARQRLAVLPFGRGNSLVRDLNIRSAADTLASLSSGIDRAIDLLDVTLSLSGGRIWRGVSASNVAIGYPATVARQAGNLRWLRAQSYTAAGLFNRPRWFDARVEADGLGQATAALTGLIVSNSRYVGPFLGFPNADLNDGIFHTMELRSGWIGQMAHNLSSVSGLGFYEPVRRGDRRTLAVTLEVPALVKIDGELIEDVERLTIGLQPKGVIFRVPA